MDAVIVQIGQAGFAVNAAGELSYAYPSAATTRNALPQATPKAGSPKETASKQKIRASALISIKTDAPANNVYESACRHPLD
jgi:hypothetical protein